MRAALFRSIWNTRLKSLEGIPGPIPKFPFGTALDFAGRDRPWEVCARYAQQYGGVTLIWLIHEPTLVLNDPALIGEVLESAGTDFYKAEPCQALEPVITPRSLFITNPPRWQTARRENPLSAAHCDDWMLRQLPPLRSVISDRLQCWADRQEPVDLYQEMQRLVFDTFARAFWGRALSDDDYAWFQTLGRTGDRRIQAKLPLVPPLHPRFLRHRQCWYANFQRAVAEARKTPVQDAEGLLQATLRAGSDLSDATLAEALATNFFGGVYSGSSTINTALYLLARHPDESGKLKQALARDLAGGDYDLDALLSSQQLDFVLREVLRYLPAVPLYFRRSARDRRVRLGQYTLPPNTQLLITNWWLHRHSPHWSDPETFAPGRWGNGLVQENPIGSGHFFPFGRGPRMCIGMPFAMFFMKLALATILLESNVEIDPAHPYRQSFFFGVMMPKGLRARFVSGGGVRSEAEA